MRRISIRWQTGYKISAREAEYALDFIAIDVTVHSNPFLRTARTELAFLGAETSPQYTRH